MSDEVEKMCHLSQRGQSHPGRLSSGWGCVIATFSKTQDQRCAGASAAWSAEWIRRTVDGGHAKLPIDGH